MVDSAPPRDADRLRLELGKRVDRIVREIAEAYRDILAASSVDTKMADAASNLRIETEAANLTRGCEELLRLISELKLMVVTSDNDGCENETEIYTSKVDYHSAVVDHSLAVLDSKVLHALAKLERLKPNSLPTEENFITSQ